MKRLAIVGAGSWGTALAITLAPRMSRVGLWAYEPDLAAAMLTTRENPTFLPGYRLPSNVAPSNSLAEVVEGADVILGVVPSQFARQTYWDAAQLAPPGVPMISATKGLERATLLRISQVIGDVAPGRPIGVMSGPTFAKEVARGDPTALVLASQDEAFAKAMQSLISAPNFRLYTSNDVIGVELGAALKNVIAIGTGICAGLGLGHNAMAALITRGLAEITRLAVVAGGQARTLAGLAGLGDLVLTCTGGLSRNRQVGIELARNRPLAEIVGSMKMVAEGVETTETALALAEKLDVELPITRQVAAVIRGEKNAPAALSELMERAPGDE